MASAGERARGALRGYRPPRRVERPAAPVEVREDRGGSSPSRSGRTAGATPATRHARHLTWWLPVARGAAGSPSGLAPRAVVQRCGVGPMLRIGQRRPSDTLCTLCEDPWSRCAASYGHFPLVVHVVQTPAPAQANGSYRSLARGRGLHSTGARPRPARRRASGPGAPVAGRRRDPRRRSPGAAPAPPRPPTPPWETPHGSFLERFDPLRLETLLTSHSRLRVRHACERWYSQVVAGRAKAATASVGQVPPASRH